MKTIKKEKDTVYPDLQDYMKVLERFPLYGERGIKNTSENPIREYFGDPSNGENGLRTMGNFVFINALLASDPAYNSSVSGVSQNQLLQRATRTTAFWVSSRIHELHSSCMPIRLFAWRCDCTAALRRPESRC